MKPTTSQVLVYFLLSYFNDLHCSGEKIKHTYIIFKNICTQNYNMPVFQIAADLFLNCTVLATGFHEVKT